MQEYLEKLISRGEMRIVEREVDPQFELAAVVGRSQQESDLPIMFQNVKGSSLPVVSNVYGSNQRMCEIIGAADGKFCPRWVDVTRDGWGKEEPYLEGVPLPDDLVEGKISDLPHITYSEKDAGPYITAGIFLGKEPDTGVPNLSFCRTFMAGDDELKVRLAPPHDLTKYQAKAESRDEPLEVAILIGPPPEVFLAACASLPIEKDELEYAAMISGKPVKMRPCKTIDVMVPLETQVVIEGRILPNVRKPEGPFGEFQGYYVAEAPNHVFEVTNVSWRKDAVFHGLLCGGSEDVRALELSIATRIFKTLSEEIPGILNVSCNPAPQSTIVQIKQEYAGHARRVLLKAFGSHTAYNKICIVVDEDVDIQNFNDVWWAVISRFRPDEAMIIEDVPGFFRDVGDLHRGRLGIDATKPFDLQEEFERKRTPGADEINLKDYFV